MALFKILFLRGMSALLLLCMLMLSACTDFTKANGRVTDVFGMPLENVIVTLEHSQGLFQSTTTDNLGNFYLDVIEPCLLICVGGNPTLIFTKQDYEPIEATLTQFGNVCLNISMRVVGASSQESRVEIC